MAEKQKVEIPEIIKGKIPESWRFYKDEEGKNVLVDCSMKYEEIPSPGDIFLYDRKGWEGRIVCLGVYIDFSHANTNANDLYLVIYFEGEGCVRFLRATEAYFETIRYGNIKIIGHQDLP